MAPTNTFPENVDVLIIGAGPAGLTLANCFNHSQVKYRVIEKKDDLVAAGQVDGIKCVTLQMLDSLGMGHAIMSKACRIDEIAVWDPNGSKGIKRSATFPDLVPGSKIPREVGLSQGEVERIMLRNIQKHRAFRIEHNTIPTNIHINEREVDDADAYPVFITIRKKEEKANSCGEKEITAGNGTFPQKTPQDLMGWREAVGGPDLTLNIATDETVRAKYVVACDGAHSWTRHHLGIPMQGDRTDSIWGVLDVIPKTNFPDIRKACFVHSAESGNMLMIPREERLVRFYVPLQDATSESQSKFIKQNYSAEYILDAARKILSPFKLEYNYCDWWSAYQIGQRVADCYSLYNRVFLAGDAVHTHSPKVGQGMNISIQDTYNLGWKLVECLQWKAHRSLLSTYESERRPVAQDLINFDQTYSKLWGTSLDAKASQVTEERITPLQAMFQRHVEFTTGLTTRYASNLIVWDQAPNDSMTPRNSTVQLAKNLVVGMRMPDFQVVNQSDAVPCQIHGLLKFDGHFRILVFAGDVAHAEGASRLRVFSDRWSALASSTSRMSSQDALLDSHIEVITIHAADRAKVEFQDFPDILHPWHEDRGWDYWKIYADGRDIFGNHGEAYTTCGINTACGCIVVVRPDGYIALIGSLEDVERINSFFAGLTKAPA